MEGSFQVMSSLQQMKAVDMTQVALDSSCDELQYYEEQLKMQVEQLQIH